eukprot:401527-Pleurochrysis_carterae.AAC.2
MAQWDLFFDDYPATVDDIPADDIDLLSQNLLPPCSMRMTDAAGEARQQAIYAELIWCFDSISGTGASRQSLGIAREHEQNVPILKRGSPVCILSDLHDLARGYQVPGDHTPFYIGKIQEDEDAPLSMHPQHPIPRCMHHNNRGTAHPWNPQSCPRSPHAKILHTITRDAILIYDVTFTCNGRVVEAASSKMQIRRAVPHRKLVKLLLADTWKYTRVPKRKRVQRRR